MYPLAHILRGRILLCIVLFALDRLTKLIALFTSSSALTFNTNTLFFLDGSVPSFLFFAMLVALLGAWFIHELRVQPHSLTATAAACIVAGALSNFLDRVRYGAIIDWISVRGLTVFNLADLFIVLGCGLVFFSFFREKRV